NTNLPTYHPKFKITNKHENLNQLTTPYNIPTQKPPILKIHIHPHLKPTSLPYKNLQIHFSKQQNTQLSLLHSLNFHPT
ncbi:Csa1 family protein, partial [Staphylococcus aureus]|uniref:Csa1 family protein n=1 Tax=Staphylococcus aureus TaxID=1280 RepID=UPI00119F588C